MWGELALAGLQLASAYQGSKSSEQGQIDANQQNKDLMDYQNAINVSNYKHRHQWEVEDLLAAGLNPILSANSAASVPGAIAPTMQNTRPNRGELAISAAKSLAEVALTRSLVKTEQAKQENLRAQTDNALGTLSIGGLRVPVNRVVDFYNNVSNKVNSAKSSVSNWWKSRFQPIQTNKSNIYS